MKKTLFILVFLLSFFLTISYCYASVDDILDNKYVEEEEDKKDDSGEDVNILIKGIGNNDLMKVGEYTNDINQAKAMSIYFDSIYMKCDVDIPNFNVGDKYYVVINENFYSNEYIGYKIAPEVGYFIRGSEDINMSVKLSNDDNSYDGIITTYLKVFNSRNYFDFFIYEEPTQEPTPEPTPVISDNNKNTVSWNSVSENLISIEEQIIDLRKDFNTFRDLYVSNNAVVSNNIIKKRLSDYTVSESIGIIGLLMAVCAGLIYLIHKSIFKWER